MRIVLLVLALANLLLLGWTQGWIAAPGEGRQAARHERQINAGLLTIAPAAVAAPSTSASPASPASPAPGEAPR